ncbi:pectinesterase family protein [Aliiruegeria lutimaris]|uniref:pectinesterase family protein n=1 Tax=Aliiruegeria lutimaris TaxID=571298 RepID=UPI00147E4AF6|nr:pectinesterase family protein [Aliiruegeria lutimaris]
MALAAPWDPVPPGPPADVDYIVDSEAPEDPPRRFRTLQAAIDRALRDGAGMRADGRRVIRVHPGFYEGPVFLPAEGPPMALFGAGREAVTLAARIDAQMPGREFEQRFGAGFATAHPAIRAQFARIAARERVTTGNSAVLRIERDDTIVAGMTIRNDYACDRAGAAPLGAEPDVAGRYAEGQHQAVACHVAGADRVQLSALRLESFQDTLYLQAPSQGIGRSVVSDCAIEGDVDFIFGGATAYFEQCEIRSRGLRGAKSWAVAPSTNLWMPHGFVFERCHFTHDGAEAGRDATSFLGRQWFEGVRATPYSAPNEAGYVSNFGDVNRFEAPQGRISRRCLEAVGKCTVQNSALGTHISTDTPWDDWSAGAWSPRYRPVQATAGDFLSHLGGWLQDNGLDYSDLEARDFWLRIVTCTTGIT